MFKIIAVMLDTKFYCFNSQMSFKFRLFIITLVKNGYTPICTYSALNITDS